MVKYSIVLPCFNEAENIPLLVERFKKFTQSWDFELILVDNGSTDNSANVFDQLRSQAGNSFIKVVSIETNVGYGHGIHAGLTAAEGGILAYSHADIQTPPEDLFKAFEMIERGEVDINAALIKGRRPGRDKSNLFTGGLTRIAGLLTGHTFEDINGQPKVFSRALLDQMVSPSLEFSYDTYVLFMARQADFEIVQFDVKFDQRLHGESKWATTFYKKFGTIVKYLLNITRQSWRYRHLKSNPIGQALRFINTGILTNIVNYLTFYILLTSFVINYMASSVSGFMAGFVVGFILNRKYTFGHSGGDIGAQLRKFAVVNLVSLGVNIGTIYTAVDVLDIMPEIGQIIAIVFSAIVNFIGQKIWVFAKDKG